MFSPRGMIVREREPWNLEMPFGSLDGFITPEDRFFVHSHFSIPQMNLKTWRLRIEGEVETPLELTSDEVGGEQASRRIIPSMKTNPILTTLVVGAILSGGTALTSGCKPAPVERTSTDRSVDEETSEAVKAALGNATSFKFPDVQVASFNGKVQLSGFVVSADQKKSAETIAAEVPGVVGVENKISLKK